MNSYAAAQIDKYKDRGVLIDANLAILYLVGTADIGLIGVKKELQNIPAMTLKNFQY